MVKAQWSRRPAEAPESVFRLQDGHRIWGYNPAWNDLSDFTQSRPLVCKVTPLILHGAVSLDRKALDGCNCNNFATGLDLSVEFGAPTPPPPEALRIEASWRFRSGGFGTGGRQTGISAPKYTSEAEQTIGKLHSEGWAGSALEPAQGMYPRSDYSQVDTLRV